MNKTVFAFFLLAVLAACGEQVPSHPARQAPDGLLQDPASYRAGREIFRQHCARCHGHTGEGRSARADFFDPPAPDFQARKYRDIPPDYLFWRIERGKTVEPFRSRGSVMPAWGAHFSDREIWQLVAYLQGRSRGKL